MAVSARPVRESAAWVLRRVDRDHDGLQFLVAYFLFRDESMLAVLLSLLASMGFAVDIGAVKVYLFFPCCISALICRALEAKLERRKDGLSSHI